MGTAFRLDWNHRGLGSAVDVRHEAFSERRGFSDLTLERWLLRNFYTVNLVALLLAAGLQLLNVFYGRFSVQFCALLSVGMAVDIVVVMLHRYFPAFRERMQSSDRS